MLPSDDNSPFKFDMCFSSSIFLLQLPTHSSINITQTLKRICVAIIKSILKIISLVNVLYMSSFKCATILFFRFTDICSILENLEIVHRMFQCLNVFLWCSSWHRLFNCLSVFAFISHFIFMSHLFHTDGFSSSHRCLWQIFFWIGWNCVLICRRWFEMEMMMVIEKKMLLAVHLN